MRMSSVKGKSTALLAGVALASVSLLSGFVIHSHLETLDEERVKVEALETENAFIKAKLEQIQVDTDEARQASAYFRYRMMVAATERETARLAFYEVCTKLGPKCEVRLKEAKLSK